MKTPYHIHADPSQATTLPASFYRDASTFEAIKQNIFLRCWHWIGTSNAVPFAQHAYPMVVLDGFLTEPIVLVKDNEEQLHCHSNVCTHRGNIVVQQPGKMRQLSCMYHGRKFGLDGTFESMPEFKEAIDFPRPCDSLHRFPLEAWGNHLFAGFDPAFDLAPVLAKMKERVGFLPLEEFVHNSSLSREYLVQAHWALYIDNYLEGFHIPFVHPDLNQALDYGNYTTEVHDHMTLQIGYADSGTTCFELPKGHPDEGKQVAAYYYWLFPNMMLNFYPWGLSLNIVKPLAPDKTKVQFITYVYDESKIDSGAGALLDKVEREDEFVVEGVQKGIRSHFYPGGRFSPTREQGVHYFHRLLAEWLNREA